MLEQLIQLVQVRVMISVALAMSQGKGASGSAGRLNQKFKGKRSRSVNDFGRICLSGKCSPGPWRFLRERREEAHDPW